MRRGVVAFLAACAGPAPVATPVVVAPVASVSAAPARVPEDEPRTEGFVPEESAPLGAATPFFAAYIAAMHARIHPEFTDSFLAALDKRPATDPLNDKALRVVVEIMLDADTGAIAKIGVVRASGTTAFDIGAINAVMAAAPFGKAPPQIRSTDGAVYVDWSFGRDPAAGCSAVNARPILLKGPS